MNSLAEVIDIQSAPICRWRVPRLWVSSARLHPACNETFGGRFSVPLYGIGWGKSETESRDSSVRDAAILFTRHSYLRSDPSDLGTLGLDQDPILSGFGWDEESAYASALSVWALDALERGRLKLFHRALPRVRERVLFTGARPRVFSFEIDDWFGAISTQASPENGIHIAAGAARDFSSAASGSLRSLFVKARKFERIRAGKEQLLDRIQDQRLWHTGAEPSLHARVETLLSQACELGVSATPTLRFRACTHSLYRIILDHSPIHAGGIERLVHA